MQKSRMQATQKRFESSCCWFLPLYEHIWTINISSSGHTSVPSAVPLKYAAHFSRKARHSVLSGVPSRPRVVKKGKNSASIFLRALHLISCYIGASVEIRHLPRMSSPSARLADALTRSTTTTDVHRDAVSPAPPVSIPAELYDWLNNPYEDWSLPGRLLSYVQRFLRC